MTLCLITISLLPAVSLAGITGDPGTDGFTSFGNSLENGVYVRGNANYGYDAYGAGFTIESGSNLNISDGSYSWLTGDTVLAVGGKFSDITAGEAGWTGFTGATVNSALSNSTGPKLQAKFGTSDAWSTSTIAPDSGNGLGSGSLDAGTIQIRSSGYFSASDWSVNANQLMLLDKPGHIDWAVSDDENLYRVARLMWTFNSTTQEVDSWEILLNVSLLGRLFPDAALPGLGNEVIMTVQNGDNAYTDALVTAVPEPATLCLLGLGGLLLRKRRV